MMGRISIIKQVLTSGDGMFMDEGGTFLTKGKENRVGSVMADGGL